MRCLLKALSLFAAVLAAGCALTPTPEVRPQYRNPVLDRDFPDPAVLQARDGWFYAYATRSYDGAQEIHIQVARSRDLVRWQYLGDALPEKPHWARHKRILWAPDVVYDTTSGTYVMYYSAEPDATRGKCVAVATATAPQGPFHDVGTPLVCGPGFENIDPMAFDDPGTGRHLLYWGSGYGPLRVQELAADRLRFLPGSRAIDVLFPDRARPFRDLVEGAWVTYRDGHYYLFYSGDYCCGWNASYAILVARADSPFGPFQDYVAPDGSDNAIVRASAAWRAPGHNSVIRDDAGDDWLLYHAMSDDEVRRAKQVRARFTTRVMLLDRLEYRNGWPRVAGDEPSATTRPGPLWRRP